MENSERQKLQDFADRSGMAYRRCEEGCGYETFTERGNCPRCYPLVSNLEIVVRPVQGYKTATF